MLVIKRNAYDAMLAHARERAEAGESACGLLGGMFEDGRLRAVQNLPLVNIWHMRDRFCTDRTEHSQAINSLAAQRLAVVGFWYSHLDCDATMTIPEIRGSHDRNASYLVLSLQNPEKPVLRSYRVWGGKADEEELLIEE